MLINLSRHRSRTSLLYVNESWARYQYDYWREKNSSLDGILRTGRVGVCDGSSPQIDKDERLKRIAPDRHGLRIASSVRLLNPRKKNVRDSW